MGYLALTILALSLAQPASSQQKKSLASVLEACWAVVSEQDPDVFAWLDLEFQKEDVLEDGAVNTIWTGTQLTEYGEIELKALVREGVLFDCSMLTYPEPDGKNLIGFEEAKGVLENWFAQKLDQDGFLGGDNRRGFFELKRCARGKPAVSAFVVSMIPEDPDIILPKDTPIPGNIRFAVFLFNPLNLTGCAERGAL
ncbi:hypothetical protein [Pelagimonas sp.]|uniref:hypothetical protein n=1 Tax=Pelagimonas sp. TaxID=2073170 RepID=UPI003D6BDAF2